ncbi:MAG: hypothetical protein H6562_20550 [Lewinellaceae bacterium]|nr:hypothetical protein [Lewinellaceae bacterium]
MPNKNKFSFAVLALALLLAAILAGIFFFGRKNIWRTVPQGAIAALYWPQKDRIPADSAALAQTWPPSLWESFPNTAEDWRFFSGLFAKPEWQSLLKGAGAGLTLVTAGLDRDDLTLAFALRNAPKKTPESLLGNVSFQVSRFRGTDIYQAGWSENGKENAIALAIAKGFVLLARNPLQVEEMAAQLADAAWFSPPGKAPSADADYTCWLLPAGMERLKASLPGGAFGFWPGSGQPVLQFAAPLFRDTSITLSGTASGMANLRPSGKRSDGTIWSLAPGNTAWFCRVRQPSFRTFKGNQNGINLFDRYLAPRAGHEIILLTLESALPRQAPVLNLAIRYPDRSAAEKSLGELTAETGLSERRNYLNYELQHLISDGIFAPLGVPKSHFRNPWATIIDSYLVFSENPGDLRQWIDRFIVGDALAAREWALDLERPDDAVTWFWDPARLPKSGVMAGILNQDGPAVIHISPEGTTWQWTGQWHKAAEDNGPANLAYTAQIPGEIAGPPGFAVDENGKARALVQDAGWKVYALDENGKILWMQSPEAPILGRPQAVKGFRDKNWWVWSTPNALYLTDFEGNPAEGFPLALSARAVAAPLPYYSAALTDYFFFVPAATGAVYAYRSNGTPAPGWNPKADLGILHQPVGHFRFDNNDYFVVVNEQDNLMAFGLDGEARFPVLGLGSGLCRVTGFQDLPGDQRLIFGDSTGQVTVVRPGGEHFTLAIPVNENRSVRVAFEHILGDARTDYLALEGNELCAYSYSDQGFTRQFRQTYPFRPDTVWTVHSTRLNQSFIGLQDRTREQIWLLDADGNVLPGYPVAGKYAFFPAESEQMPAPLMISARGDRVYGYLLGRGTGDGRR